MILDSPIISGSLTQQAGQTAEIPRYTAVSSSFLAASASFDARIDSIESTTASLSPRINALESFTASADGTYVNVSGDSMSGDLTITGSLIVTDRITAQEFHTEYVSSSVVFQSGSTKFGNSGDDIHSFTGSLQVDGNVIASNLEGVFSSSAQITGSLGNYYIVSGTITQTTWDNIANKPGGIVSGSEQLTASYDERYVISGSITQTTWDNIANKPADIVSGAAQVTESLDLRYRLVGDDITFDELTFKPTLISGSSQLDGTTIQNLSGSFSGSFSGSYRGDGSGLTGLAAGAKFHTQSEAASTWTFVHNLSTQYPNVTVYDSNNNIVLPQSITATNANTLVLEFGSPVSGYATAGIGGIIEVNGRTIKQYFASSLEWRFEHNFGDRFANIQTYDSNYEKIIPQTIALTDATSSLITFPEVTEGWAIGTIGGDLPSISSSYAGYVLQVSDSAPYTASWTPAADVLVTNAVNAETASYLNSFSQSLIPAVSGAYDLGSLDKPFRHIYVGTGSIYLVDDTGTIVKTLSGDTIVTNDNLSSLNSFTASNFTTNTFTSSATARLNSLEEKTGSLASTGSNTFYGTQTFTGSVYISENLIVQGSSSLQNITASAVDIGTNKIILNVDNPAVRYAGISVYDSGSTGGTGSLFWDSVDNHWLYEHPADSGAPYNSAILISGPKNEGNLGEELELVNNYVVKAVGGDHISSSAIYDDGNIVKIQDTALTITGSRVGINTSFPTQALEVSGSITTNNTFYVSKAPSDTVQQGPGVYLVGGSGASYTQLQQGVGRFIIFGFNGSGWAERFTINNTNGRVGIGTASPSHSLSISTPTDAGSGIQLDKGGVVTSYLGDGGTSYPVGLLKMYDNGSQTVQLYAGGVSYINGGNVGIGLTNPSAKLHIGVSGGAPQLWLQRTDGYNATKLIGGTLADGNGFKITMNTTDALSITSGGNVGINNLAPFSKLDVGISTSEALCIGNTADTISSGDLIGAISFVSRDGSTYSSGGVTNIRSYATQTYNTGNVAADLRFYVSNGLQNQTAAVLFGTEAMRITNEGKVGIGTTSPLDNFHVYADNGSGIGIGRNLTNDNFSANLYFYPSALSSDKRNWGITTYYDRPELLQFRRSTTTTSDPYDDGVTLMTLDAKTDRVGIGTASPGQLLHIYNTSNYVGMLINGSNAPQLCFAQGVSTTSTWKVGISGNDGNAFSISSGTTNNDRILINSSGKVALGTGASTYSQLNIGGSTKINRSVYNWYQYYWTGNSTYWHMKTNMSSGAGGNTQYTMSLFKGYFYSYSSASVLEGAYGFHNWSGTLYNVASTGNLFTTAYVSSDGYIVLVIPSGAGETGVTIDWHQAYAYPFVEAQVTAAKLHGSTTGGY